jgi:hypothetical protein
MAQDESDGMDGAASKVAPTLGWLLCGVNFINQRIHWESAFQNTLAPWLL